MLKVLAAPPKLIVVAVVFSKLNDKDEVVRSVPLTATLPANVPLPELSIVNLAIPDTDALMSGPVLF